MEAMPERFATDVKSPIDLKLAAAITLTIGSAAVVTSKIATPYMAAATFAYLLLCAGIACRTRRNLHAPLMATGVLIDLALVLVLEFQRSAIATAASGELGVLQKGHIAFSAAAVALYIPTIFFGARAILRRTEGRKKGPHVYLGRAAFLCRTGGFVLMFSLLEHVRK